MTAARRLSPLVLVVAPVQVLRQFAIPVVGVLLFGRFSAASLAIAAAAVVLAFATGVFRWWTFRYRVYADRIELTRTFLSRRVRAMPLQRVRGVEINTPLLHRLLGLAIVHIETAGDDSEHGVLDAVSEEEADRLRAALLHRAAATPPPYLAPPPAAGYPPPAAWYPPPPAGASLGEPPEVFVRARPRWYLYAPLSGAYLLAPLAVVAALVGFVQQLTELNLLSPRRIGAAVEDLVAHPAVLIAVSVAAAVLFLIAMPVASVVVFALVNWDFTVYRQGGALVCERGLLTRRSVSLERRRIRGWVLVDGPLERLGGVARLQAVVTGLGGEARGQLLPSAPRDVALAVAERAVLPLRAELAGHPPRARLRRLVRAVGPWAVAAAVAWPAGLPVAGAVFTALALLGVPLGEDRYRALGHAFDGERISVRSGSLSRRQAVVERRALVGWRLRQSWFQRRAGLATLTAAVGAGAGGYAAIDLDAGDAVRFAAAVTPEWVRPFLAHPVPGPAQEPGPPR